MLKKLYIYTLKGCEVCENLKSKLNSMNIIYTELCCFDFGKKCDDIENQTGIDYYPIVNIETINNNNTVLCLASTHEEIEKTKQINPSTKLIYKHSINGLVDYIKIYYND